MADRSGQRPVEETEVGVLLAPFDSETYLAGQLDSLLAQTRRDFLLLVRDDGSRDGTLDVVESYRTRFGGRLVPCTDDLPRGHAKINFSGLMAHARERRRLKVVLFSDHDDVWFEDKVETVFAKIKAMESVHGEATPLLVHSDAQVVGEDLRPIDPSVWHYQHIDPERGTARGSALVNATVTGCTMMINRPLLELATPVPEGAVMHDWWLNLAAAFGRVGYVATPTMLYRQHGTNVSDARPRSWRDLLRLQHKRDRFKRSLANRLRQARAFHSALGDRLAPRDRALVEGFLSIRQGGWLQRRRNALKGGYTFTGVARNVALLAFL